MAWSCHYSPQIHRGFQEVPSKRESRRNLIQCALLLILPAIPCFGTIATPVIHLDATLWSLPGFMFQINDYAVMQPNFGNVLDAYHS
ncbi:unnamed protein product, partial [Mesorhabditis belari]|uniref:Uncharacterized protein n=1 Tax=Mesorhabditis belari TaxID=2138241 RepID=A0AAF3FH48_9BILA